MKIVMQADDFGRSHGRNTAIDEAMREGLVRSTALMMGSAYTGEALELAEKGSYLRHVHCHLNLSSGANVGDHFVPLNEHYKTSRFCKDGEFESFRYYKPDYSKYSGIVFEELETQFLRFKELTRGKANYRHIDFHRYANLSLPVDLAYRELIKKYGIKTARFFGAHERYTGPLKKRVFMSVLLGKLQRNPACVMKSSRVDFFLTHPELFKNETMVELFVHPDSRDGIILDTTKSASGRENVPLSEQIKRIRDVGGIQFLSWEDV